MFKIIALAIIVLGCTYIGFYYGENLRRRNRQLEEILKGVLFLNNEVIYSHTPIPDALNYVSYKVSNPLNTLLLNVSKKLMLGESVSLYHAVTEEYQGMKNQFFIQEDDKRILIDFCQSLGESGVYGQDRIFTLTIENLKSNCKEAATIAAKNIKMYRALGVCTGVMIAIVLL